MSTKVNHFRKSAEQRETEIAELLKNELAKLPFGARKLIMLEAIGRARLLVSELESSVRDLTGEGSPKEARMK